MDCSDVRNDVAYNNLQEMNVLILVLSARRDPWGALMDCSLETWDAEVHPKTRTLYYIGKSNQAWNGSTFSSRQFDEELERVAPRTMEAYEHALTIPDWDFMARTHSSTYVHKRNLVDFCDTLHRKNLLCGLLVTGERPFLWGGGSYIMSRDVIEKLVAHKDRWNMKIMEDNGMTDLANEIGIPLSGNGRMASIDQHGNEYQVTVYGTGEGFTFTNWDDVNKAQPHHYWRCKQDLRRHEDLRIFRELHKHLK